MGKICGFAASNGSQTTLDTRQLLHDSHSVKKPADFTDFHFSDDRAALASEGRGSFHRDDQNGFACLVDGYFSHYDRIVDDFAQQGIDIRSCSPAEAILHYYRHMPLQSLKLLRGSFVFAIWNGREGHLVLGRDRYGTRRLYYARLPHGLLFGSDLTGLARNPMVPKTISSNGLLEYFSFGYIHPPHTIYDAVRLLDSGEYVRFENGRLDAGYFHSPIPEEWAFAETEGITEEELVDTFDSLVIDSVRSRLPESDTVASYLSGGLDTSLLVAVLSQHTDKRVVAYTLGSNDPSCDEAPAAREVAKHLGIADHHAHYITKDDFVETLELLPDIFGQPIGDISSVPNFVITRAAGRDFDEVFAGDGPDGLFGNWDLRPWFYYYKVVPRFLRGPVAMMANSADRLLKLGLNTPSRHISELLTQPAFAWVYHKKLKSSELERFLGEPVKVEDFPVGRYLRERTDIPLYERLRLAFSLFFVTNGVLQKSFGVHSALLIRQICPFYDNDLVDFVQKLPTEYKIRGIGYGKYLHKKLLYRYLPPSIWDKRKQGFIMNINEFGQDVLRGYTDRYLTKDRLSESGLVDVDLVLRSVEDYYGGNERMGPVLYTFLVFEMWRERFSV